MFWLQSWQKACRKRDVTEGLSKLGTKGGSFKDKDLCFVYKSGIEGFSNLGSKDGPFKDKDLCSVLKSWK